MSNFDAGYSRVYKRRDFTEAFLYRNCFSISYKNCVAPRIRRRDANQNVFDLDRHLIVIHAIQVNKICYCC